MTTERIVRIAAGLFLLVSLALGASASPFFVSGHWLWLAAFVGLNLFQSGFTRVCPLEVILVRLGVRRGPAYAGSDEASRPGAMAGR